MVTDSEHRVLTQTARVLRKMSEERKLPSEVLAAESEILVKRLLLRRRPAS